MITVTSAEKKKIEGQMRTALPFINDKVDFQVTIEDGSKGRSRIIFKKEEVEYQLPIFYVAPSTDDSVWEMLTDSIEEEKNYQGIFVVKFNSSQHLVHNAETCALTYQDLNDKNALSEMCRLCSYFDFDPYKIQLFDATELSKFFQKLGTKEEKKDETEEVDITDFENLLRQITSESNESATINKEMKEQEEVVTSQIPENKKPQVSKEEDSQLDSDIRALINDCFGIF